MAHIYPTHRVSCLNAALSSKRGWQRLLHRHTDALACCAGEMLLIKPLVGGERLKLLHNGWQ